MRPHLLWKPLETQVLGFVPFRYNHEVVKKLMTGPIEQPSSLTTLLRHPVEHFWGLWHDPEVTKVREVVWGAAVTVADFLADPLSHLEALPASLVNRFRNGASRRTALRHVASPNVASRHVTSPFGMLLLVGP
jgi:hypothetical protein